MFPGLNREGPRNTPKVDKRKTILTHIGVKRRRMMFVVPAISPPFLCITFATLEMGKRVAESREEAQNFDHAVLLRTKRTPLAPKNLNSDTATNSSRSPRTPMRWLSDHSTGSTYSVGVDQIVTVAISAPRTLDCNMLRKSSFLFSCKVSGNSCE